MEEIAPPLAPLCTWFITVFHTAILERQIIQKEITEMEKTLKIEGMMCTHCEMHVKKALEALKKAFTEAAKTIKEDGYARHDEDALEMVKRDFHITVVAFLSDERSEIIVQYCVTFTNDICEFVEQIMLKQFDEPIFLSHCLNGHIIFCGF